VDKDWLVARSLLVQGYMAKEETHTYIDAPNGFELTNPVFEGQKTRKLP
jgi:hypothetical protein